MRTPFCFFNKGGPASAARESPFRRKNKRRWAVRLAEPPRQMRGLWRWATLIPMIARASSFVAELPEAPGFCVPGTQIKLPGTSMAPGFCRDGKMGGGENVKYDYEVDEAECRKKCVETSQCTGYEFQSFTSSQWESDAVHQHFADYSVPVFKNGVCETHTGAVVQTEAEGVMDYEFDFAKTAKCAAVCA